MFNTDLCIKSSIDSSREIQASHKKMREKGQPKFSSNFVTLEETLKEVALLSDKKASQASDIPLKVIKENRDLIAYFILHNFNHFSTNVPLM